jgi:hypothetical protein
VNDITHTIQLAVAPVFLLTSLGTILSVLSGRLSRVVDRGRVLSERISVAPSSSQLVIQAELSTLMRRRLLVNRAITCCTVAALLVCLVIAFAFLGFILRADFGRIVAGLFIAAISAFTAALWLFLREIFVAVESAGFGTGK